MPGIVDYVEITKGKTTKRFRTIQETCKFFEISANAIYHYCNNKKKLDGFYIEIVRLEQAKSKRCCICKKKIKRGDFCTPCYHKDLTGKDYIHKPEQELGKKEIF